MDTDTRRILALRVTDEKIGDSPVFSELLAEAVKFLDAAVAAADPAADTELLAEAADAAADAATAAMCRAFEDAVATLLLRDRSPVRVPEASVSAAVTAAAAAAGRVIYADGAYASRPNLCLCKECGVVPFIRLKRNATTAGKGRGDVWGGGSVRGQRGRGARNVSALTETEGADALEEWKENGGYGKRWIVEIILSAFKRLWKRRACAEMGQHGPGDQTKGVGLQHADRYGIGECRPGAARADPALRPSGNCICTGGSFAVCASPLPPPPPTQPRDLCGSESGPGPCLATTGRSAALRPDYSSFEPVQNNYEIDYRTLKPFYQDLGT